MALNESMESEIYTPKTDSGRRSSSRSIKRRKFDDELVESSLSTPVVSGAAKPNRVRTTSSTASYLDGFSPLTSANEIQASTSESFALPASIDNGMIRSKKPAKPTTQFYSASNVGSGNRRHKKVNKPNTSAGLKDFGRWKPVDDLALIQAVLQTCDLRTVYQGVKFTCKFTFNEIAQRWYALLYDRTVSRIALSAIRNLHPETIAAVEAKSLFSEAEEKILTSVKSNSKPDLSEFDDLIQKNPQVFHRARTAKSLHMQWTLMKQHNLLNDQTNNSQPISMPPLSSTEERNNTILNSIGTPQDMSIPRCENIAGFQEYEELLSNSDLMKDTKDPTIDRQLALSDRTMKKEMRTLEDELNHLQKATASVTGINHVELDNQTLAVLRGRFVRFLMRSKEITLGRKTADNQVDVDLSLEGPAWKVSRQQATIRLKNNGEFYIASEGKRPIYVDGNPILRNSKCRLLNNSVLEVSGLKFIFLVNHEFIEIIRQEAAKMNLIT